MQFKKGDIVQMKDLILGLVQGTITFGNKFEYKKDNYDPFIDGCFYKTVYEPNSQGLFYQIYDKFGISRTCGYYSIAFPIKDTRTLIVL